MVTAYAENRAQAFAAPVYSDIPATGDETPYGFAVAVEATEDALGYRVYADLYENGMGDDRAADGTEVDGIISPRLSYAVGVEVLDRTTGDAQGDRIDLAARMS